MKSFSFQFLVGQEVYVFTLNRVYFGKLLTISEDSIGLNVNGIYEIGIDEPTDFVGAIFINKNMIESIFKAEK